MEYPDIVITFIESWNLSQRTSHTSYICGDDLFQIEKNEKPISILWVKIIQGLEFGMLNGDRSKFSAVFGHSGSAFNTILLKIDPRVAAASDGLLT